MNVKDPESAFLIIQRFIHRFSEKLETKSMKNELNLLEEIREIGFDKILDTNDEFTRFKLKLTNENVTISLRIFKAHLEYSLDSFKDFPIKTIYDVKKGFLLKVMKSALNDYKEIEKVSKEIFLKLDENFLTLKPERFDKETLKRRIQCGQCGQFGNEEKVIIIYYDYETKNIILRDYETKYSLEQSELLFTHLKEIILTTTTQSDNNSKKECGICYSNYLDGNLTDFICPNTENCKQVYHVSCLREWFRANPESRTIFDKICGTCLFCDKVIFIILKKFKLIFYRKYF